MHRLDEKELKLAALALDEACQDGELAAASLKFSQSLRRRGIRIQEFGVPDDLVIRSLYAPTAVHELKQLSKRLGRCVCCGTRIL
jgi:hypothetical protein